MCLMLLAVKEYNTTGSFYLCHLLNVLSIIIISGTICTSAHLYTNIICTDGTAVYVCPCMLMVTACALHNWIYVCQLWYAYIGGYCNIMDNIYVTVHVL